MAPLCDDSAPPLMISKYINYGQQSGLRTQNVNNNCFSLFINNRAIHSGRERYEFEIESKIKDTLRNYRSMLISVLITRIKTLR